MLNHPLLPKLRQLRLSGMLLTLENRATQATEAQLSPTEFLALMATNFIGYATSVPRTMSSSSSSWPVRSFNSGY